MNWNHLINKTNIKLVNIGKGIWPRSKETAPPPHQPQIKPPNKFCATPWATAVLHRNGDLTPCTCSSFVMGNWQKENLKDIWLGQLYQDFRKKIINGEFPGNDCRICFASASNAKYAMLRTYLAPVLFYYHNEVSLFLGKPLPEISAISSIFSEENSDILNKYMAKITALRQETINKEINLYIDKLDKIGIIVKSFHENNLTPPVVAPHRAVQIISKCNARCIHCVGENGRSSIDVRSTDQTENQDLDKEAINRAFSNSEDIIRFFHQGSELLFYKNWKEILNTLNSVGVRTPMSTNGMLLTESNVQYLVDNKSLASINISFDGAKKETLETTQINVKFDKKIQNIKYLFQYAEAKKTYFPVSYSFLLMKKNFRELPGIIPLIEQMRGSSTFLPCNLGIGSLVVADAPIRYKKFLYEQHISLVNQEELINVLQQTLVESQRSGIPVLFVGHKLEDFISGSKKIPQLPKTKGSTNPLTLLSEGRSKFGNIELQLGLGWNTPDALPTISRAIGEKSVIEVINPDCPCRKKMYLSLGAIGGSANCRVSLNSNEILCHAIQEERMMFEIDLELLQGKNIITIERADSCLSTNMANDQINSEDSCHSLFRVDLLDFS